MLDVGQSRELIVIPALETIEMNSIAAQNLLIGTALQESCLMYLKQINGPALGIYQMEPETHDDIWNSYLSFRPEIVTKIHALTSITIPIVMTANLWYATAMARIHYFRVPVSLPEPDDIEGQAQYWKQYYNTPLGRGTVEEYLEKVKGIL